jgi:hypothetical protein
MGQAYAAVYFSYSDRLATIKIPASRIRGKISRVGFLIGAGFGVKTVNGITKQANIRWDDDAYLSSENEIN